MQEPLIFNGSDSATLLVCSCGVRKENQLSSLNFSFILSARRWVLSDSNPGQLPASLTGLSNVHLKSCLCHQSWAIATALATRVKVEKARKLSHCRSHDVLSLPLVASLKMCCIPNCGWRCCGLRSFAAFEVFFSSQEVPVLHKNYRTYLFGLSVAGVVEGFLEEIFSPPIEISGGYCGSLCGSFLGGQTGLETLVQRGGRVEV